jgi:N-acetylglucosamine-6-phosphate deacetylase
VQTVGLSLEQAARVASTTPARTFGLSDVGALQPGMRADLVVLDADLQVTAVMRRGSWVSGDPTRTKEGS